MRAPTKVPHHKRVKRILKEARGYRGGRSKLLRTATEAVDRARRYAYRDRRNRKRDFRRLWITRISIACRERGMMYSRFIYGLSKAGIELDRKQLSEMAINDVKGFDEVIALAKKNIEN